MLLRHSNLIDLYRCSFLAPPPLSRPQPILNGRASAAPLSFFAQEEGKLNALSQCQTEVEDHTSSSQFGVPNQCFYYRISMTCFTYYFSYLRVDATWAIFRNLHCNTEVGLMGTECVVLAASAIGGRCHPRDYRFWWRGRERRRRSHDVIYLRPNSVPGLLSSLRRRP